ncbi:MAG TPA: hypothetical protein DCY20_10855 [Firmicutes bacterium]|nr:hypothetical protein [Bacillota bacterium]
MDEQVVSKEVAQVVKIEEWLLTILIGSIPIINVLAVIYWSFSKKTNLNKKNFARALLTYLVIIIAIVIIAMILM